MKKMRFFGGREIKDWLFAVSIALFGGGFSMLLFGPSLSKIVGSFMILLAAGVLLFGLNKVDVSACDDSGSQID